MKIGILTAGGDCPGINAAIRGVGKTAIVKYGMINITMKPTCFSNTNTIKYNFINMWVPSDL